jgi:hypothetical protein
VLPAKEVKQNKDNPPVKPTGLAIAALILGIVGCTFVFAPVIQYPWAFASGAAAITTGALSQRDEHQRLGGYGVVLGIVAVLIGFRMYQQVQDALSIF